MGIIATILGSLTALLVALGGIAQSKRSSVPAGCMGVKFRLGIEVRNRPNALGVRTIRHYPPGYVFTLPLLDVLEYRQVRERNTDDEAVAVKFSNGHVYLVRANTTYYLTNVGLDMALCEAVHNFDHQVATFFKAVVSRVLSQLPPDTQGIERLILEELAADADLQRYGVVATVVSLREMAPAPMTQFTTFVGPVIKEAVLTLAGSDLLSALGSAAEESGTVSYLKSSVGANGAGSHR